MQKLTIIDNAFTQLRHNMIFLIKLALLVAASLSEVLLYFLVLNKYHLKPGFITILASKFLNSLLKQSENQILRSKFPHTKHCILRQ